MFAIHGSNLPTAYSYQEALKVYDEAIVVKDSVYRHLLSRRDTSKRVLKGDDGSVAFRYHHHNLVTWYGPNNVSVVAYDSRSSVIFAERFLPHGLEVRTFADEMYFGNREGWYMPCKGDLDFTFSEEQDLWVPNLDQCITTTEYALNKSKAAAIRKKIKPWIEYRDATTKILGAPNRAVLDSSTGRGFALLQRLLEDEETDMRSLKNNLFLYDSKLVQEAYILGGAVTKTECPPGRIKKPSLYAASYAWAHI